MNFNHVLNLHPTSELISSDSWFLYLLDTRDGQKRDFIKEGQTGTSSNEQDFEGNKIEGARDWVQKLIRSEQSIFSQNITYKNVTGASIFEVVHDLRQYRDAEIVVGVVHFSRKQMTKICKAHGRANLDDLFRELQNRYGFYSNRGGIDREEVVGASLSNIDELLKIIKQIYEDLTSTKTAGKEEFKLQFLQAEIDVLINGHLHEHQRCLIQATGGFGKSTMSLRIACSDLVMAKPGCTLVLTPVKATGSDFQANAKKFQYFGREAVVVLLAELNEKKFVELMSKCKTDGNMLVVIATVQDVRGKLKLKDEDGDSAEDAEAVVKELLKLETKYKFLLGNIRLLIRDEIHLQYAAEQTYNALSGLKPDLVVDMTATLTAREAVLFGYNESTIASCTLMRVLKAKRDGVPDVQRLPQIGLSAASSMNLPREILDELGVTSEAEITAAKLFAIEGGKFKFKNAVLKLLERTFSLGAKFGALEGTNGAWGPALCGKEPMSTGVYLLVVPRGDSSFSASRKCKLIVELGAAYDEDALFISAEDLEYDAELNGRSLELSVRRLQLKNPGRKIVIVTHRKLLTGVNIPQLEGIALWDSIESQALFLQLWYRLFRAYDGKKTAQMVVYEPGVAIGDTSVAHAVGQLLIDELDGLDDADKKRKLRELEGLISLQMYAEAGKKQISTEDLFAAYEASYAKAMADQFGGTVRTDTIRSMLGESYAELLALIQPIRGSKTKAPQKSGITDENGGKTNKPGSKGSSNEEQDEQPARTDDAVQTLQAILQQLPWLAYETGEYSLDALLKHPFVSALFQTKNASAVLSMVQSSSALREFMVNRLKYTKVDQTKSVTIGRGETEIVLDGGIVLELLAKLPVEARRVLLVNPKRHLLEAARQKWPDAKIVVLTYDGDPYIGLYAQQGLTVISVEKELLCGTMEDMKLRFDIIVGNPPYQDSTSRAKNQKLWPQFCQTAFGLLETDGWIAFVTPSSAFREVGEGGKVLRHLTKVLKLEAAAVHKVPVFDAGIETCHWVASTQASGISAPAMSDPIVDSILAKMLDSKHQRLVLQAELQPVTKDDLVDDGEFEILFSGDKVSKTNVPLKMSDSLKLVFPFSASYHKQFVSKKPLGMFNMFCVVHDEAEAERIKSFTLSKLYKFFASKFNRTSGFTPAVKNSMLPAVDLSRTWTDTELYDHFKLTQAEIDLIERTVK